jgi:hypothetical protein
MPQLFKDITLFFTLCPHPAPWSGGEEPAAGCQFKACAEMHLAATIDRTNIDRQWQRLRYCEASRSNRTSPRSAGKVIDIVDP